jgi:hypothetical protein
LAVDARGERSRADRVVTHAVFEELGVELAIDQPRFARALWPVLLLRGLVGLVVNPAATGDEEKRNGRFASASP